MNVAPYTGAWIEIGQSGRNKSTGTVAPYTGAWIEIICYRGVENFWGSLPTRERGLKSKKSAEKCCNGWSLPTRERGLKSM